jgi:hypothetical protein
MPISPVRYPIYFNGILDRKDRKDRKDSRLIELHNRHNVEHYAYGGCK